MKKWLCTGMWVQVVSADSRQEAESLFRRMISEGEGNIVVREIIDPSVKTQ